MNEMKRFAVAVTMVKDTAESVKVVTILQIYAARSKEEAIGMAHLNAKESRPDHNIITIAQTEVRVESGVVKIYQTALEEISARPCCGCCKDDEPQCEVGIAKDALRKAKEGK